MRRAASMELAAVHGTVVVAEERAPVREYVRGLLERALPGVAQVSACGGAAVLEVIDSLSSLEPSERGPVVVVSSVHMSDVDGLGVAEHAWCASSPVSVVLLGDSTPDERARARALEAVLIEGPEGFSRLVAIVAQLLTPPTIH